MGHSVVLVESVVDELSVEVLGAQALRATDAAQQRPQPCGLEADARVPDPLGAGLDSGGQEAILSGVGLALVEAADEAVDLTVALQHLPVGQQAAAQGGERVLVDYVVGAQAETDDVGRGTQE